MRIITSDGKYRLRIKSSEPINISTKNDLMRYNNNSRTLKFDSDTYNIDDTEAENETPYYQMFSDSLLLSGVVIGLMLIMFAVFMESVPTTDDIIIVSGAAFVVRLIRNHKLYKDDQYKVNRYNKSTIRD